MDRAATADAAGGKAREELERRRERFQAANPGVHFEHRSCSYPHCIALWTEDGQLHHLVQPDMAMLLDALEDRFGIPGSAT